MGNIDSKKHRRLLLQTMKEFIKVCKDNDIKYVAAYGTVLGAVRHKGLIPWDDDIDVYMTRDNYERFLALKPKLEGSEYTIFCRGDKNYTVQFAKFCYMKSSIWELRHYQFMLGVFVDIFPVDEISPDNPADKLLRKKYARCYRKYLRSFIEIDWKDCKKCIKGGEWKELKRLLRGRFYYRYRRESLRAALYALEDQVKQKKGSMYADYSCNVTFIEKNWIENTIEVPFEDFSITIPAEYDKYLTAEYGDYMTPPPPGQRNSGHNIYFCDLDRRVSIDEAKRLMKNGEN